MKYNQDQIADFIVSNYPGADQWDFVHLTNWVCWAMHERFLMLVGSEEGIKGVAIIRPVFRPHEIPNTLDFDPEGDTYFVDLAVALHPKRSVVQGICFAAIKRFGMRDKIAFQKAGLGPVQIVNAHEHRRRIFATKKVHHG